MLTLSLKSRIDAGGGSAQTKTSVRDHLNNSLGVLVRARGVNSRMEDGNMECGRCFCALCRGGTMLKTGFIICNLRRMSLRSNFMVDYVILNSSEETVRMPSLVGISLNSEDGFKSSFVAEHSRKWVNAEGTLHSLNDAGLHILTSFAVTFILGHLLL